LAIGQGEEWWTSSKHLWGEMMYLQIKLLFTYMNEYKIMLFFTGE
jgi:hypothetical protein